MRTMYDSVDPSGIPAGASFIACYEDGLYANVSAMRARFPSAMLVPIAVSANHNSPTVKVLDVETGDATPDEAPGWVSRQRAIGGGDSVYCNSSTWPAVKAAFAAQGVTPGPFWIAAYDGDPTIPAGAVAKQWADNGGYDTSSVADYWPGIDSQQEDPMAAFTKQDLIDAARQGATAALEDPAVRGLWQRDNTWWGDRVASGDTTGMDPQTAALVTQAHEALKALAALPVPVLPTASVTAVESATGVALEQAGKALEASATPPAKP